MVGPVDGEHVFRAGSPAQSSPGTEGSFSSSLSEYPWVVTAGVGREVVEGAHPALTSIFSASCLPLFTTIATATIATRAMILQLPIFCLPAIVFCLLHCLQ